MPDALSGLGVERYQRVGEEVVARPESAVVRGGRSRQRDVHSAELFICRDAAPRAEIAREFPRPVSPGFGAELTVVRDDMEGPEQLAAPRVEAAHVLRRTAFPLVASVACAIQVACNDNDVADD